MDHRNSGKVLHAGRSIAASLILALTVLPAAAQRTSLKPGWNLFSVDQDVEIGRQTAADAEKQLAMLNDRKVDDYLDRLGKRLAAKAPGAKYPYRFKAVNDASINAFALPGGFLYVNRGTIEAADDEAQLAGVVGHEIAHVALRHGTNQASKAYAYKAPLAILGGVIGTDSIAGVLAQIGGGFAVNSVLLKYSRDAERQADLMGTQILYDSGYDPRAMAQFFEKLQAEGTNRAPEFFSSHPNPENRMGNVMAEIERMGGRPSGAKSDSAEFRSIQAYVRSLPPPPKAASSETRSNRPEPPSTRLRSYQDDLVRLRHPENWFVFGREDGLTLAPEKGRVDDGQGGTALAYGMMIALIRDRSGSGIPADLEEATSRLIDGLRRANPNMRVTGGSSRTRIGGEPALSTRLGNDSPLGGKEIDWLLTVRRSEGLFYFVAVAPESDFGAYRKSFENLLGTVRFLK